MSDDTPWSSRETLSRLSRQQIGKELATQIAEKLKSDNGERGLWNTHRDYCGHGLIYSGGTFQLLKVEDGSPSASKVLQAWRSADDFADWLSRQSDRSLSGIDDSEPALRTTVTSELNNQRITRDRLLDYLHDCTGSLTGFRNLIFGLDHEFKFLVETYGFNRVRPRMDGRECVVRYRKPIGSVTGAGISITSEFGSTPFITVSLRTSDESASFNNAVLMTLAMKRVPDWIAPEFPSGNKGESEYRRYFKEYADVLQRDFPDLLTPEATVSVAPEPT